MARWIKIVRHRGGLTQDQLVEQVRWSPKYMSGIERGVADSASSMLPNSSAKLETMVTELAQVCRKTKNNCRTK